MFRLVPPSAEPAWHDLPHGVRVLLRPISSALHHAANVAARRELEALDKAAADVREAGGTITGLPDLADPDVRLGVSLAALSRAYARLCIADWTGVVDDTDAPLPCTPENAALLAEVPAMADAITALLFAPIAAVSAEGNG
jgi:hypothetical protein